MTTVAKESGLNRYVDLKTVTQMTNVPNSTLRQWIADGRLRAYHVASSRRLRVRVQDVEALFEPVQPKTKHRPVTGD
ncbi:MAG: hypothetical protein JWR32_3004 [Mycobacterium sp.]|jgi:excisionase family DNA binding protein|nr:hypothetical protein [Mycobacterium sp.]